MPSVLVWFRRDLRLNDNAALHHALVSGARVHCAFVFDSDILTPLENPADRRVEFIWVSVGALKAQLERQGGGLHVLHGSARRLIPKLAARLRVNAVHANRDYEPFARARDHAVAEALAGGGRELRLHKDHVIRECDEVLTGSGQPFRVFTPYMRAWLRNLAADDLKPYPVHDHLDRLAPGGTPMPTLASLGFTATDLGKLGIRPGEAGARALWRDFQQRIGQYREARDFPGLRGPSQLSVHLRFGTLSIRELVRFARERDDAGAQAWLAELIWREFYQMLIWHFPHTVELPFQARYQAIAWPNPPGHFEAWREARTGYPIVDAAMRQINATGYMHNRLRMIAASFLVKDLHVDWHWGERYFAARLIDYDQAANVGGWQWCAGIGTDAQPWFRILNPVAQSMRFDPDGRFLRRYLPELAQVPERFIHAPWKMPAAVQAQCGVAVGRDYPAPIVDHARARETTLALFRAVQEKPTG